MTAIQRSLDFIPNQWSVSPMIRGDLNYPSTVLPRRCVNPAKEIITSLNEAVIPPTSAPPTL